jgi:hypothetical protein
MLLKFMPWELQAQCHKKIKATAFVMQCVILPVIRSHEFYN